MSRIFKNLTEVGKDIEGKAAWSLDCEITIHNLHPIQAIDDVTFRIISIAPPMKASPAHHPRTQDTTLRESDFPFTDILPGKALLGDQTGHVRLFNAVKHIIFLKAPPGPCQVLWCGPDSLGTEFVPEREHLLTVEVAWEAQLRDKRRNSRMLFSTDTAEPVFAIVPAAAIQIPESKALSRKQ